MTQEFLTVFEQGQENWSGFSVDVPGCGGLGTTLEETRENLREGLRFYFDTCAELGLPFPKAVSAAINFNEVDPDHQQKHYFIEWLTFEYNAGSGINTTAAA